MGRARCEDPQYLGSLVQHHLAGFRLHHAMPAFVRLRSLGPHKLQLECSPLGSSPPPPAAGGALWTAEGAIAWWDDPVLAACLTKTLLRLECNLDIYQRWWLGWNGEPYEQEVAA